MPQSSYEYAMGRISVLTKKMLDEAQMRRIAEAADEMEAMTFLVEAGYGGNGVAGQYQNREIDCFIRDELQASRKIVWELTPEPELTSLFFLKDDIHNMKTLLKARLLGTEAPDILMDGSVFPVMLLQECINNKEYDRLPAAFKDAFVKIEAELEQKVDPLRFSAQLDCAMFRYINDVLNQRKEYGFVRRYFSLSADFQNARSVIRARLLHWDQEKLGPLLLPGGEIAHEVFLDVFDTPLEQLGVELNRGTYGRLIFKAIEDYVATGNASIFKRSMEAAQMNVLRAVKWDIFTLGPIVWYLLGREAEAKALRLIFGAKKSGFEVELPELYA